MDDLKVYLIDLNNVSNLRALLMGGLNIVRPVVIDLTYKPWTKPVPNMLVVTINAPTATVPVCMQCNQVVRERKKSSYGARTTECVNLLQAQKYWSKEVLLIHLPLRFSVSDIDLWHNVPQLHTFICI